MRKTVRAILYHTLELLIVQLRIVRADPSTLLLDLLVELSFCFLYLNFLESLLSP